MGGGHAAAVPVGPAAAISGRSLEELRYGIEQPAPPSLVKLERGGDELLVQGGLDRPAREWIVGGGKVPYPARPARKGIEAGWQCAGRDRQRGARSVHQKQRALVVGHDVKNVSVRNSAACAVRQRHVLGSQRSIDDDPVRGPVFGWRTRCYLPRPTERPQPPPRQLVVDRGAVRPEPEAIVKTALLSRDHRTAQTILVSGGRS